MQLAVEEKAALCVTREPDSSLVSFYNYHPFAGTLLHVGLRVAETNRQRSQVLGKGTMDSIKQMLSGRNLLDSASDEDEPTIKSFHCWQVDWDAGASTVAGKVKNIGMSPTKLLVKDRRSVALEMRRVSPEVVGGEESEQCLVR